LQEIPRIVIRKEPLRHKPQLEARWTVDGPQLRRRRSSARPIHLLPTLRKQHGMPMVVKPSRSPMPEPFLVPSAGTFAAHRNRCFTRSQHADRRLSRIAGAGNLPRDGCEEPGNVSCLALNFCSENNCPKAKGPRLVAAASTSNRLFAMMRFSTLLNNGSPRLWCVWNAALRSRLQALCNRRLER
jgi:hypothetical protein